MSLIFVVRLDFGLPDVRARTAQARYLHVSFERSTHDACGGYERRGIDFRPLERAPQL